MIRLGNDPPLDLPDEAVTQTFGFIGRRGSGKTYAAGVLVEGLLEMGAQVVILDPIGNWWGLRLAADGTGQGFDIPILGGEHGDIPLEVGSGALVADALVDTGTSAVLDVSAFRKGDRKKFVTDFAERLYARKKTTRSAMMIVLEEAQVFAPQRSGRDEARMLGAIEDIVRLGRNYGIGAALISQRPQSVNKEVLNQVECLVVLQLNGSHERDAIAAWVRDKGLDIREMVDGLPSLPVGAAFVWSPQWLNTLARHQIATKGTYDASSTPTFGGTLDEAATLRELDLATLRDTMAEQIKSAKTDDPRELRKRIAQLEADVRHAGAAADGDVIRKLEVRATTAEDCLAEQTRQAAYHAGRAAQLRAILDDELRGLAGIRDALGELIEGVKDIPDLNALAPEIAAGSAPRTAAALVNSVPRAFDDAEAAVAIGIGNGGARRMLDAIVRFNSRQSLTRQEVAIVAGLSVKSGTFSTYWSALRGREYIAGEGSLNVEGLMASTARSGDIPTRDEVLYPWRAKLGGSGARRMLEALVTAFPSLMTRAELAAAAGLSPTTGTFSTYMSKLRRAGLLDEGSEPWNGIRLVPFVGDLQ